jgi:hypothetical protein
MATIYLNAGYDGTIYESSKVAKEGFDPHVSATTGNTTYRKVYKKGLFGFYQGVELRDSKIGQQLSIHLIDGENNAIYFQIPFKNQKSGIGTFAESLIEKLPFLQVGTLYRFFAYNMPVEGTVYKNIGISVKFASDWENAMEDPKVGKLSRSYTTTEGVSVQGDIPAIIWRENFDKTTTADSSAKDTYLYNVLCQYGKVPTATPVATPQAQPAPNGTTGVPVQQPIVQQQSALSPNTGFHQPSPQVQQPVQQQPVQQQPVQQQPVQQQPVQQQPVQQQPVQQQPVQQQPVQQQPVQQQPVQQQPVQQQPVQQQPVQQQPVQQQPVQQQPVQQPGVQYMPPPPAGAANDDLPF